MEKASVDEGRVCALLSYLLIGIIWYFADEKMKKNSFAKFHAKQGIVLLIAAIAWSILLSILWPIWVYLWFLMWLLELVPWVFVVMGIINALNGKEAELPIIGQFASKLTF
jgi:uncharacterized membrane protein